MAGKNTSTPQQPNSSNKAANNAPAPTSTSSGPSWQGFTSCQNLYNYGHVRQKLNQLRFKYPPEAERTSEKALRSVNKEIKAIEAKIKAKDTTQNWAALLQEKQTAKKNVEKNRAPFKLYDVYKAKLDSWDTKWDGYKEKYNKGIFSQEDFQNAMSALATDLDISKIDKLFNKYI